MRIFDITLYFFDEWFQKKIHQITFNKFYCRTFRGPYIVLTHRSEVFLKDVTSLSTREKLYLEIRQLKSFYFQYYTLTFNKLFHHSSERPLSVFLITMTELFLSWLSSLHPLSLKLVLKNLLMFSMCKLLRESICWSNSLFLIFWKCKVLIRPWLMIGIKFPFQSYFQSYSKNILLILISEKRSSTSPCGLVLHEGFSLNSLVLFFLGEGGGGWFLIFFFLFLFLVSICFLFVLLFFRFFFRLLVFWLLF